MSYQDTLDRKATIKIARRELNHFSDLLKLHETSLYNVGSPSYDSITTIVNYLNYDQKQLEKIIKKDKQFEAIMKVYNAIMKLSEEEMQVIYTRYILQYKNEDLDEILGYSERKRRRIMNNALFNIAIILHIEIKKD